MTEEKIVDVEQVNEDHQQENFEKLMWHFNNLDRKSKRKLIFARERCKRLQPRVGDKWWSQRQLNNKKLQWLKQ